MVYAPAQYPVTLGKRPAEIVGSSGTEADVPFQHIPRLEDTAFYDYGTGEPIKRTGEGR